MNPQFRNYVRSITGQLHLFIAVFLGAIALSASTWILRPYLFEPYIRQLPVKSHAGTEVLADGLRRGVANADDIQIAVDRLLNKMLDTPEAKKLPRRPEQLAAIRVASKERMLPEARDRIASSLYWAWLDQDSVEGNDELLKQLLIAMPDTIIQNMHRTIVVGNTQQQLRAFRGLQQAKRSGISQADAVIEFAHRKAKRRGEQAF
ncbi:MAG: hypothetical protein ACK5E3_06465 [Planctomycetota bacterium]